MCSLNNIQAANNLVPDPWQKETTEGPRIKLNSKKRKQRPQQDEIH